MYLISLIKQIEIAFVGSKTGRLLIPSNSTDIFFHQMFVFFVVEKKKTLYQSKYGGTFNWCETWVQHLLGEKTSQVDPFRPYRLMRSCSRTLC